LSSPLRLPSLLAATVASVLAISVVIERANETAGEWRSCAGEPLLMLLIAEG